MRGDETIDHRGRDPEYRQLAAILRTRIRSGQYAPGQVMPSEQQIRDEFGISRGTARRAIALLRGEGIVDTIPGRGSYVTDPLPPEDEN